MSVNRVQESTTASCPTYPGVCTETTPGHVDHSNHEHRVRDQRGETILDIGFVQASGGGPAVIYVGGMHHQDLLPEEVRAKTAELRRLLDEADRMADRLMKLGDTMEETTAGRCAAAHPDDPTPCDGPVVATVLDRQNAGADGCEHHAARLLASLEGGRVYGLPHATPGTAIRVFKAAASIRPFPWATDAPRTEPSQLSRAENRTRWPVFEVEQSGADPDGWDPDDPYGDVAEYERRAE
jgi:hypothetical protein